MAEPAEIFRCPPMRATLSRTACGARSREVSNPGNQRGIKLVSGTCEDCAVGRAHAAGERPASWPDGSPIVLLTLSRSTAPASMPLEPKKPVQPFLTPGWAGVGRTYRGDVARGASFPVASVNAAEVERASAGEGPPPAARDSRERPAPITAPTGAEEIRVGKTTLKIELQGRTQTPAAWAKELGVTASCVRLRHYRGAAPDGSHIDGRPRKTGRRSPRPSVDLEAVNDEINAAFGKTSSARTVVRPDVELLLELVGIDFSLVARREDGALTLHIPAPTSATA